MLDQLIVMTGLSLSIHVTCAIVDHSFPARSIKVKINEPLPVKAYHVTLNPVSSLLNPVSSLLNPVNIAMTSPLVRLPDHGVYSIDAVGVLVYMVNVFIVNRLLVFPNSSVTLILQPL